MSAPATKNTVSDSCKQVYFFGEHINNLYFSKYKSRWAVNYEGCEQTYDWGHRCHNCFSICLIEAAAGSDVIPASSLDELRELMSELSYSNYEKRCGQKANKRADRYDDFFHMTGDELLKSSADYEDKCSDEFTKILGIQKSVVLAVIRDTNRFAEALSEKTGKSVTDLLEAGEKIHALKVAFSSLDRIVGTYESELEKNGLIPQHDRYHRMEENVSELEKLKDQMVYTVKIFSKFNEILQDFGMRLQEHLCLDQRVDDFLLDYCTKIYAARLLQESHDARKRKAPCFFGMSSCEMAKNKPPSKKILDGNADDFLNDFCMRAYSIKGGSRLMWLLQRPSTWKQRSWITRRSCSF